MPLAVGDTRTWQMPGACWGSEKALYVCDSGNYRVKRFSGAYLEFLDAYEICPSNAMPNPFVSSEMSIPEGVVTLGNKCYIACTPAYYERIPSIQVWDFGQIGTPPVVSELATMVFNKEVSVPGLCGYNYGGSFGYHYQPSPIGVYGTMIWVAHWSNPVTQYSVNLSIYTADMVLIETRAIAGPPDHFITFLPFGSTIK